MSEARVAVDRVAGRSAGGFERPSGLGELRQLVSLRSLETLVPVAGGTQLDLGDPPEGPFRVVDVSEALSGEPHHEPDDMTLDVPAATTLAEIDSILSLRGQFLPLDPPLSERASIGGALAVGSAGPLRTRYGLPRDLVLGATVLRADGELVHAGGRVVKNVTGYDLVRLWCGSLGTLGLLTSVTVRVLPRPRTVDLVAPVASPERAADIASRIAAEDIRPLVVDASMAAAETGSWNLLVRVDEFAVSAAQRLLGDSRDDPATDVYLANRDLGFGPEDVLVVRVATVPADLARCLESLSILGPSAVVARPLAGFARATWRGEAVPPVDGLITAISLLRQSLTHVGGSVVIERFPPDARGEIDAWGDPGPSLALMRKVKAAYDPAGRFNRGRFVGGI